MAPKHKRTNNSIALVELAVAAVVLACVAAMIYCR